MTLDERCDEIIRLIDEVLADDEDSGGLAAAPETGRTRDRREEGGPGGIRTIA